MTQLLEWLFASPWRYLGALVLVLITLEGIADVVRAARKS